jgi:hypothetical protein
MTKCITHQAAAIAVGVGAGATSISLLPHLGLDAVGAIALSGYVGALLPDIDDENSLNLKITRFLTKLAAVVVPSIQFFYRPTDLILAVVLSLFMVSRFWDLLHAVMKRGSRTHSVIAAVCLSLGVAWVAYLTADYAAALPAFIAAGTGYLLHLLLDDLQGATENGLNEMPETASALTILGRGKAVELYGIIAIGLICGFALWGI